MQKGEDKSKQIMEKSHFCHCQRLGKGGLKTEYLKQCVLGKLPPIKRLKLWKCVIL